jgi:hypothetical protein
MHGRFRVQVQIESAPEESHVEVAGRISILLGPIVNYDGVD